MYSSHEKYMEKVEKVEKVHILVAPRTEFLWFLGITKGAESKLIRNQYFESQNMQTQDNRTGIIVASELFNSGT